MPKPPSISPKQWICSLPDVHRGTHRIINLIVTDCPGAVIYVADLTGNTDLVESIMQIRKVAYVID